MNFHDVWTREHAEQLAPPSSVITREQQRRQRELEQRLLIAERDETLRLEWARQFPEDIIATEAFYAQKEAAKAKKKASREKHRAESAARKAARAEKATRKEEEKKNGAGPSTTILSSSSSSSSFEWTSTPVSETTPSSHSSDYDSESE
jgi:hypothetical protein